MLHIIIMIIIITYYIRTVCIGSTIRMMEAYVLCAIIYYNYFYMS